MRRFLVLEDSLAYANVCAGKNCRHPGSERHLPHSLPAGYDTSRDDGDPAGPFTAQIPTPGSGWFGLPSIVTERFRAA